MTTALNQPDALTPLRVRPGATPAIATEYMVPMRDGVVLATDVYLPENGEPTETVLIRLPYDKAGDYTYMPEVAPRFTREGYAVVVQDVRGKFRSTGVPVPWVNEVADASDTLDWIVQQTWSNGRVGMWGESYYGFTQWAAASTSHPALRAIVPQMTGTLLGGPIDPGGPEWHIDRVYRATYFADRDAYLWNPNWQRPYVDDFERFFATLGSRPSAWDLDFPTPSLLRRFPDGHPFDARPIPTLMVLGWFDNCLHFSWRDYAELVKRPAWNATLHLRIEAIDHECYHFGDVPFATSGKDHMNDQDAKVSTIERIVAPAIEFFDVYLRELPGAPVPPRVSWEQVNDEWNDAEVWPPPETVTNVLELRAGATLADGRLGGVSSDDGGVLNWTYDPENPVPSLYSNTFAMLLEYPDEQELSRRPDVLTFTGAPAEHPIDLCGPVELSARVHTTGPYMDVFARLLDVAPDGSAHYLARGQSRVRMTGDDFVTATVSLAHVGYRLMPGHSLRLLITNSDAFEYVPGPGTDEHPWLTAKTVRNEQSLDTDALNGTRLTITVRGSEERS